MPTARHAAGLWYTAAGSVSVGSQIRASREAVTRTPGQCTHLPVDASRLPFCLPSSLAPPKGALRPLLNLFMSSPSPQLPLGQVIGSRYRIQSLIGRGGMGMVYAATHELTGRRVALKLMLNDCDDSPILQERFLSEARIAAAVRHPNIVDVLDMGLHGGSPFIVMELLEGVSLERVLESQNRISVEQALTWLLPIVGALAVLHEAGIVHRDVKPSNIFMSALPRHPMRPKLLDFGLARVVSDLRLTRSGTVIGTPLYMAPEHAAGQVTGPQADVWSIGVVLYESLAGCSPFNYTDRQSLAMQVIAGLVRPLSQVRPDLPPLISSTLARALTRDLTRRYPDMRSFAQALHGAARASGVAVPADPDPIGLPEYAQWQSGERSAATTLEHFPGTDSGNAFSSTPRTSSPSGSRGSDASLARSMRGGAGSARLVWLGVLAVALALVGAWFWNSAVLPSRDPKSADAPPVLPSAPNAASEPSTPTVRSGAAPSPPSTSRDTPAGSKLPGVESTTDRSAAPAAQGHDAGVASAPARGNTREASGLRSRAEDSPASTGSAGRRRGDRGNAERATSVRGTSERTPSTESTGTRRVESEQRARPASSTQSEEVESEWK
jgi:serine/threonine protein kinase